MFASNRIRTFGWIATLLLAVLPCRSQTTLREQLQSCGIPESSFSKAELDGIVDGAGGDKGSYTYFVYLEDKKGTLTGYPHMLRYDQRTGAIIRSELRLKEEDPYCCGSPEDIKVLDDYILLSFHYNPSASCILVLDKDLKLMQSLDGFDLQRVARNKIVLVENMVHFAQVHPERLQFIDLSNGKSWEIYPLKNDDLRNRYIDALPKRMPEACKKSEEICNYGMFEEGCVYLGGDGKSRMAFECGRSATYVAEAGKESVPYFTDSAIYLYAHDSKGSVYCEQTISEDEATALDKEGNKAYDKIKARCTPNLAVISDDDGQ